MGLAGGARLLCPGSMNVRGLGPFLAGYNIEDDFFTFVEGFETSSEDCRMMYKNILSGFLRDEAKSFFVIPPFYFSTGHSSSLLSD